MAKPIPLDWRKDPQLPNDLINLRNHLDQLPLPLRDQLIPLCDRAGHYARLQSRLVRMAQDAVDQLQLDIKYLLFAREAPRRERDELRGQLEPFDADLDEEERPPEG